MRSAADLSSLLKFRKVYFSSMEGFLIYNPRSCQ
jgi:hypothetical protein